MSGRMRGAPLAQVRERLTERGAVAVEFALVLPLVIVLLLGSVTAGVAYSRAIGLTNAVREGARFGAVTVSDGTWASSVTQRTAQTQFDDLATPPDTTICATLLKNSTTAAAVPTTPVQATPSCPIPAPSITVQVPSNKCVALVWASRGYEIQTGLLPSYSGSMKPKSVALYERSC